MKRLIVVCLALALQGCAWMVGTVDDDGRITDGNGNFVGHARYDSFGGSTATCTVRDAGRGARTARCW